MGRDSPNQKGSQLRSKSKTMMDYHSVIQNQCFNCKQIARWKRDCLGLRNKQKDKSQNTSEVNVTKSDGSDSDSSCFALYITSSNCHLDTSEWVLDTGASYHIYPKREMFASFEKLDRAVMLLGDGHTYRVEGIRGVCIILYDGTMRELKKVRYISRITKNLISVGDLEEGGPKRDS